MQFFQRINSGEESEMVHTSSLRQTLDQNRSNGLLSPGTTLIRSKLAWQAFRTLTIDSICNFEKIVFHPCTFLRAPATEIDVTVRGGRARSVGRSVSYIISLFVYHKIRDSLFKNCCPSGGKQCCISTLNY